MKIAIMDTTLRDGEQTSGVSFTYGEKLGMAKLLLDELKVDYLEVASARVSEGEHEAVKKIETHSLKPSTIICTVCGHAFLTWDKDSRPCEHLKEMCKGLLIYRC